MSSLHFCFGVNNFTVEMNAKYVQGMINNLDLQPNATIVTVMEAPTSFSLFSPTDCTLYSHFSFNDFVMVAFPDLTGDLDDPI